MNYLHNLQDNLLTAEKLEILRSHKIKTCLDFIQSNNDKIASLTEFSIRDIIAVKEKILLLNSSVPIRGDKLYEGTLMNINAIQSGIQEIDKWLDGGLPTGTITEIYGHSNSGKTQFVLHLAANASLNCLYPVIYLFTNDFNIKRLVEFMHILNKEGNVHEALQRIVCAHVADIYQLFEALHSPETKHCKVLIIDSLATIFLPLMGDSKNDAFGMLNKLANDIKRLSVLNSCLILTVNHATSKQVPTLGRYWIHIPHLRLFSRRKSANEFVLTVSKSVFGTLNESCCFSYPRIETGEVERRML